MKKWGWAVTLVAAVAVAVCLSQAGAWAAVDDTFQAANEGVDIWYKVLSESGNTGTVQVGKRGIDEPSSALDRAVGVNTVSVTVPQTVTNNQVTYTVVQVGGSAFFGCTALTSVTLPGTVTVVGNYAFSGCAALGSISLPNVTTIGSEAFRNCAALETVDMPAVTTIKRYALTECRMLASVSLPETLQTVGSSAFYYSGLTSVAIPKATSAIGADAFGNCASLTAITVHADNAHYTAEDDVLYDKAKTTLLAYPKGKTDTSFTVPDSVSAIEDGAFRACFSLTSITLPNGLTTIGKNAFLSCSGLTSMSFPAGLRSIGAFAFLYCGSLDEMTFAGSNAPSLGNSAFERVLPVGTLYHPAGAAGYGAGFGSFSVGFYTYDPLKDWTRVSTYTVTVTDGTGDGNYPANDTVEIVADTPASGTRFVEWQITPAVTFVAGDETTPTAKFTMPNADVSAVATYENLYAVTVTDGTGSGDYAEGETVEIAANPPPAGQQFKQWQITPAVAFEEGNVTTPTAKFTMRDEPVSVTATYGYAATVTGGAGSGVYAPGDTVEIVANPPAGMRFKEWHVTPDVDFIGGTTPTSPTARFRMPANAVSVLAVYEAIPKPPPTGDAGSPGAWGLLCALGAAAAVLALRARKNRKA